MTIETYDEVLLIARRLPLVERLRLASTLVSEATRELPIPSKQIPTGAAAGSAERLLGSITTEHELSNDDLDRIRFAHLMEKHA